MNNREYKIITDVTCDLPLDIIEDNDVGLLYLTYELDGVEYIGKDGLSPDEFYKKMRAGSKTKTSQISPGQAESYFENVLKEGKDILYIAFSSGLSGSYNSVTIAAKELSAKYPDSKITVVDSLCASLGEGLLVYKAIQKKKEGLSHDELTTWLEENKLHLCHIFSVDDLMHLHRGGRVSKTSAIAGSILGIKPILHVDNEGRLVPISKVRGRKQSLVNLVDKMAERVGDWENNEIAICHGDCIDDANYVADLIKEKFGVEKAIINYTGTVIGAHSGPGTISIFFMGDYR